jgi:hypothetical protein
MAFCQGPWPSAAAKTPLQSRCGHLLEAPEKALARICPAPFYRSRITRPRASSRLWGANIDHAAQDCQWRARYPGGPRRQRTADSRRHRGVLEWGHAEDGCDRPRHVRWATECREDLWCDSGAHGTGHQQVVRRWSPIRNPGSGVGPARRFAQRRFEFMGHAFAAMPTPIAC